MPHETARAARVLIAFDGSEEAQRSVRFVGRLLPGAEAVILYVSSGRHESPATAEESERFAQKLSEEGAELAREEGLRATAAVGEAVGTSGVWSGILTAAGREAADLVVVGSHGHSRLREMVLGGVSTGVVHHSKIPVLVVPEPAEVPTPEV